MNLSNFSRYFVYKLDVNTEAAARSQRLTGKF